MAIRVLNCGTMRPYFPPVENGVTCLLVESNDGLVLVDTGLGLGDLTRARGLMRFFLWAMRSAKDPSEAAVRQVEGLGLRAEQVRHIVMTHLHFDHAGGLPDFPAAEVHIYEPEYRHVVEGRPGWEYNQAHWAHGPKWVRHRLQGGHWYGINSIRLAGIEPEMWMVPLVGHTPGHCGVAVKTETGWILHAGDAAPFDMAVDKVPEAFSRMLIGPHLPRLRWFLAEHPEVFIVGAHMTPKFYQWSSDHTL